MEQRILNFEVRDVDDSTGVMRIEGIVNSGNWSKKLGTTRKFYERVEKGCWQRAIQNAVNDGRDIRLLYNHEGFNLMATTKNNSLHLEEIDGQLRMSAILCDTSLNRDVYSMIKSGMVDAFSFGFNVRTAGDRWEKIDGERYRTLTDIDLFEVSALSDAPAYEQTAIFARAMEATENAIPEEEMQLAQLENEIRELNSSAINDLINQTVQAIKEEMAQQYETVLNDLNNKIDTLKDLMIKVEDVPTSNEIVETVVEVQEEKQVEEVVEPIKDEVPEVVVDETPQVQEQVEEVVAVDISQYENKIKELMNMKEVIESDD